MARRGWHIVVGGDGRSLFVPRHFFSAISAAPLMLLPAMNVRREAEVLPESPLVLRVAGNQPDASRLAHPPHPPPSAQIPCARPAPHPRPRDTESLHQSRCRPAARSSPHSLPAQPNENPMFLKAHAKPRPVRIADPEGRRLSLCARGSWGCGCDFPYTRLNRPCHRHAFGNNCASGRYNTIAQYVL